MSFVSYSYIAHFLFAQTKKANLEGRFDGAVSVCKDKDSLSLTNQRQLVIMPARFQSQT